MPDTSPAETLRAACECGCGQPVPVAKYSDASRGWTRGQPIRFVKGHNTKTPRRPAAERFWERVNKTDGCWLWTGCTAGGYGHFYDPGSMVAHRWAYEDLVGPIPDGLELDHVRDRGCTSTLCVNPAHLEPVTHAENMRRRMTETCKKRNHPFDEANTYWYRGQRRCRACQRLRKQAQAVEEAAA